MQAQIYKSVTKEPKAFPYFATSVSAGQPCPVDEQRNEWLDLNDFLVEHPADTFFVRVQGESMLNAGIHDGDLLIVDRAKPVKNNGIVVAHLNGECTVKRISKDGERLWLLPENDQFEAIPVTPDMEFDVFGVVTNVIHAVN